MNFPKVFAATAIVGLTGLPAFADTLVLNDGSRLRGTLVSMNRQTVVFDEDTNSGNNQRARTRRVRVPLDRVDAIDFTDQGNYGSDDSWSNDTRSNDSWSDRNRSNDTRSNDRRSNDTWSNNDGYYGNDTAGTNSNVRQRAVLVNADRPWTDTGITVRAGDVIRFDPTGVIQWGPGREDGPGGEVNSPVNRNRPMANQPGGALIGRIGTGSGDMFYVGAERGTFRARTAGRLYLGINDDHLQDNSGSFRVIIEQP
jgi:hypothetical protein